MEDNYEIVSLNKNSKKIIIHNKNSKLNESALGQDEHAYQQLKGSLSNRPRSTVMTGHT